MPLTLNFVRESKTVYVGSDWKDVHSKQFEREFTLRTVISNLIMMASHVTIHARQLVLGLGISYVWRHLFADYCESSVAV